MRTLVDSSQAPNSKGLNLPSASQTVLQKTSIKQTDLLWLVRKEEAEARKEILVTFGEAEGAW